MTSMLRQFFSLQNPVMFIGILMAGFSLGECGKANGWWT